MCREFILSVYEDNHVCRWCKLPNLSTLSCALLVITHTHTLFVTIHERFLVLVLSVWCHSHVWCITTAVIYSELVYNVTTCPSIIIVVLCIQIFLKPGTLVNTCNKACEIDAQV